MNPNLPSFDDPTDPRHRDALGRPFGTTLRELSVRLYQGPHAPSRKPTCYLEEHERVFHPIRHPPLRIVELGVQGGWSMLMWREYFPGATIIDVVGMPKVFPSHQHGIVGLVKQLADYTQATVTLEQNAWPELPICRVSFLPNMAVITKCDRHLIAADRAPPSPAA